MHLTILKGKHLHLRSLALEAKVGATEWEKSIQQSLLMSLTLLLPPEAGGRDDLSTTFDYAEVVRVVRDFVKQKHFALLEYLGEQLARCLQSRYEGHLRYLLLEKENILGHNERAGVSWTWGEEETNLYATQPPRYP